MESKQTKTSKKTPTSASTRDAALRVVLEVVDEKGCGFVPTLERLGQRATCKAFALCDVGIATNAVRDGTFSHRSDGPRTVDAAIAQRLAAALDSAAVKPKAARAPRNLCRRLGARAAERAAVACSVLRNATAPLMAADVHVALVLDRRSVGIFPRAPLCPGDRGPAVRGGAGARGPEQQREWHDRRDDRARRCEIVKRTTSARVTRTSSSRPGSWRSPIKWPRRGARQPRGCV